MKSGSGVGAICLGLSVAMMLSACGGSSSLPTDGAGSLASDGGGFGSGQDGQQGGLGDFSTSGSATDGGATTADTGIANGADGRADKAPISDATNPSPDALIVQKMDAAPSGTPDSSVAKDTSTVQQPDAALPTPDAPAPADMAVVQQPDAASQPDLVPDTSPDAAPVCVQAGGSCAGASGSCCSGHTCVAFPELGGDFCTANCTTGDGCTGGCCVPLQNGAGSVCAPAPRCATCKKAGEENCQSDADCCAGAACISESNSQGQVTRVSCKAYCAANANCYSGCCAAVNNQTYRVCAAANFCPTPAPPPVSGGTAAGTYAVTVSRESQDLYKVQFKTMWIKTQFCYEYVYYDKAILVWNGKYASGNRITFSSGQYCDVVDILASP